MPVGYYRETPAGGDNVRRLTFGKTAVVYETEAPVFRLWVLSPLTEEFIQNQIAGEGLIPFLSSFLVISVFVGIQFLTYLLNIWVYYGFYCVTVVGGIIGFVYYLKKE